MNENLSLSILIPLLFSILYWLRKSWRFPPLSRNLAPAFLLIVWLTGLCAGQWTGSLAGATWVSTIILLVLTVLLSKASTPQQETVEYQRWSIFDWMAMIFIAFAFFRYDGNDPYGHYSVTATIIRDNVPPSSLNDPNFPLIYHAAFDLGAATFVKGFGTSIETGLDIFSLVCVIATIHVLQFLSRFLFQTPWAQQSSRLLFLFGLGPTYLNFFREPSYDRLHGGTIQSYIETIFRRPYGLNFVIFLYLLAFALYIVKRRDFSQQSRTTNLYLYLLPASFLLPLASEELTVYSAGIVLLICILQRLDYKIGVFWLAALIIALPLSGVFRAHFASLVPTPLPKLTLSWPLLLPRWPEAGATNYSAPLFSRATIEVLVFEWGPIFFLGLLACLLGRDQTKRRLAILVLISFIPAFLFRVENWVQADLDRFLFYGTTMGFFLSAAVVERFELRYREGKLLWTVPVLFLVVLATLCASSAYVYRRTYRGLSGYWARVLKDGVEMRKALSVVGPKEQVKSDPKTAQRLTLAGFVVVGPMSSNVIGLITSENAGYFPDHAEWIFLKRTSDAGPGENPIATYEDFVLVRADK